MELKDKHNLHLFAFSFSTVPSLVEVLTHFQIFKLKHFQHRLFLLILLITLSIPAFSQVIDSTKLSVEKCLSLSQQKEKEGRIRDASDYMNKAAFICWDNKNYQKAIEYFEKSLKLNESINNEHGVSGVNSNLGMIYTDMKKYETALPYMEKTLQTRWKNKKQDSGKVALISALINTSVVLNNLKKYNQSAEYLEEALVYAKETSDAKQMRSCYGMLAETYEKAGNPEKTIQNFNLYRSFHEYEMNEKDKDKDKQIADAQLRAQLANIESRNKELELLENERKLKEQIQKSDADSIEIKELTKQFTKTELARKLLEEQNKLKEEKITKQKERYRLLLVLLFLMIAFAIFIFWSYLQKRKKNKELHAKNIEITRQNVLINEQKEEILAICDELELKNDLLEKRNAELNEKNVEITRQNVMISEQKEEILAICDELEVSNGKLQQFNEDLSEKNEQISKQKEQIIAVYDELGLKYEELIDKNIQITEQNAQINQQKEEIQAMLEEISHANNKLKGSIDAAKTIQLAVLNEKEHLMEYFPESFVLFLPKDNVSGDFYWFTERNGKILIAAVDCTGHGVPGAFMSMLGCNLLNDIVSENIIEPDKILNRLHAGIIASLHQREHDSQEGMDLALYVIDKEAKTLEFAGAQNPLIIIHNNELTEIEGSPYSIGGIFKETDVTHNYEKVSINLQSPTWLYTFSDGFQDQFGGEKNRKFSSKRMKELLLSVHQLPMHEQHEAIYRAHKEWKGNINQIDDILIIGVKIT